jgi:hypothetical protein
VGSLTVSRLRAAERADGPALARLFGEVPMEGSLVLSTRREPDFFALYDIQRGAAECRVFEHEGQIAGLGTIFVRSGWWQGQARPVGYLGDLRSGAAASRQRGLVLHYGQALREVSRAHGCDLFLTGILASNAAAMNALVRRRSARGAQPRYWPFRRFDMVSIQFTGGRRAPPASLVRTATPEDVPTLRALLAADHQRRPFGYRFDDGELEHRLRAWPGFSLERTYVALDGGRIVGCASAWDAAAVKRYRVEAYRGGMRTTKVAFNLAARVLGWTPLPQPGSDFRYFYLCNVSVERDDPAVLRALLTRIYADFKDLGYHFFSLGIYADDPLAAATRGFIARRLPFELYVVTNPDSPEPAPHAGRPGFEMALA